MSGAEDIYRMALEELASGGNEQAKLALAMGTKVASQQKPLASQSAVRELQAAEAALHDAINHNSTKWTSATDRAISRGLAAITRAIIQLA